MIPIKTLSNIASPTRGYFWSLVRNQEGSGGLARVSGILLWDAEGTRTMHSGPQSSRSRGAPRSACTRSAAPQREGTRGTASTDCHLAHSGIYTYPCSSGSVPKLGHLHQCEFTVFCHKTHSLLRRTNAPGEKRPKSLHMQYTYCAIVQDTEMASFLWAHRQKLSTLSLGTS